MENPSSTAKGKEDVSDTSMTLRQRLLYRNVFQKKKHEKFLPHESIFQNDPYIISCYHIKCLGVQAFTFI